MRAIIHGRTVEEPHDGDEEGNLLFVQAFADLAGFPADVAVLGQVEEGKQQRDQKRRKEARPAEGHRRQLT